LKLRKENEMKKISIILISFLLFASGFSQAQKVKYPTRKGIVQEATMIMDKNGKPKKKPLQGVRIFTGKGVSNSSNAKGEFTLTPDAVPFKITQVKKNEYTLLSPEQGTRTYYDNNEILDVLMVSDKTFNNYMDSQMNVATEAREKKKKQALEEIEQQKDEGKIKYGEYLQKQDSINKAYDEQMKRLVEFVERSCKEFFKGMEQIDKEIDDCIMKGNYLKADSLLISKGYFNERIKNIEKLKQVTDQYVEDAVSDCRKYADINLDKVKYTNALLYLDTARVLQEKYLEPLHPDLATTYNEIGAVYSNKGNLDEALKWYNKALKIDEQVSDPLSLDLATTYNNIGIVYSEKGNLDESLKWHEKSLKIREQVLDSLNPSLAISYNNIGCVYSEQGNNDEALKWYDKALYIQEQVLDSLSPDLAALYGNKGFVYSEQGNLDEALKWLEKALKIDEQVLDPLSPSLATSYNNIGTVYYDKGNFDEGLKWIEKALKIREQILDPLSPYLARSYNNIGVLYSNKGDFDEGLKWLEKSLKIREQVLDPLSLDLALLYKNIGVLCKKINNDNKALEYFNKALPGYIKNYGEEHERTKEVKQRIEECKQALGE
jgi:tetratricopeptide (TPR) repeat protein